MVFDPSSCPGTVQLVTVVSVPSRPTATSRHERGPAPSRTSTRTSVPQSSSAAVSRAHTPDRSSVAVVVAATGAAGPPWPAQSTAPGPATAQTTAAATAYSSRLRPVRPRAATSDSMRSSRRGPALATGCTRRGVALRYSINWRAAGPNSVTWTAQLGHSMRWSSKRKASASSSTPSA